MQKLLMSCHVLVVLFPRLASLHCFVFGITQAAFGGEQQKSTEVFISVALQQSSLPEALDVIGSKGGFGITYNDADLPKDLKVTYHSARVSVADALKTVLHETSLSFREHENNIIIFVKPAAKHLQKGTLGGKLKDDATGELLIGASVRLIGTPYGNITNAEGDFLIRDIPEGVYQVAVSYLGYETLIARDVAITANQHTVFDRALKASGTQLQDITVIGDRVLSGNVVETNESALVKEIRNSSLIITGISAQQIARSVDQDAGEVARRLPGVSLQNNFVNIRGMHERYNITYLNGMVAPSSESDRRAFSYDLLPSNMIDKMTVYRSPGPELLADWAGGAIKIETKNTSIARQFEVNLSSWYRPGSTFEDYYTNTGGKKDWLGKDDGTRALPAGFPGVGDIPAGGIGSPGYFRTDTVNFHGLVLSPENMATNAKLAKSLYNSWDLKRARSGPDYRAGINYYDAWKIGNVRLSNLTSINTTQAVQLVNQSFVPQRVISKDGSVSDSRAFQDSVSRKMARWGVLQNLSIAFNERHTVELKGIFNRLGTDETLVRQGNEGIVVDDGGYVRNIIYTYRSRSIGAAQVAGSHTLGQSGTHSLKWSAAYSTSIENVPAQRSFYNTRYPFQYILPNRGSTTNALYYIDTKETNHTYTLDYEKKFGRGIFVRAGAFYEGKTKSMDTRMINISTNMDDRYVVEGDSIGERNYNRLMSASLFREDGSGGYIFDNENLSGQYDIRGKILAGYTAVNFQAFRKKLNIYGGLRYEGQDLLVKVRPSRMLEVMGYSTDLINKYVYYWLPSVNVSWSFTDRLLLRAAYGKTLNRPNYREYIPLQILDPRLDNMTIGTDSLTDAQIHNMDLRLEFYPRDGEFISVGVFYKKLRDAIEQYAAQDGLRERIKFDNTDKATVYGVELELRKSLNFVPVKWIRRFSTIANFALLHSEVKFTDGLIPDSEGKYFLDNRQSVRPLEGTARYVINAGLYYDQEKWGTKVSLLYNIIGQRLVYAPSLVWPATYELPRSVLDLTVRQRVTKFMEFRFAIQDILNQPRRLYRDFDRDARYDPWKRNKLQYRDWMFQEYKPGSYYMIGLNFTF
ncbi:TonB-dependent receptor [Chryseolinea soli]|uniref:TonB-dependent receptor n=1 Tax=Chryseolinea soli TaxID=2321403 RepID=A0A385SSY8_9BACT|nr:TonB-dependent receptor [Chryseolinea soli]AYB31918.1 hypothetical protein D4L85_15695 [Chryseolinea soli]